MLLHKFDHQIIRILLLAAFIALLVGCFEGHYTEGVGIVVAILLATFMAFINEYRACKEFDALNAISDEVLVKVVRNGNVTTVPMSDIVVGDVAISIRATW